MTKRSCMYVAVAFALLGCSDSHKPSPQQLLSRMIYSPNGEPLNGGDLGRPTCNEALTKWFYRIDSNHTGSINAIEFMVDARMQFSRMDIDHNGYLVPEELDRFRKFYRQEQPNMPTPDKPANGNDQQEKKHRTHDKSDGQEYSAPDDLSDPVMSADTDLDNKVTPEEFLAHAQKVFSGLDKNHDGVLSRDEVLARCAASK